MGWARLAWGPGVLATGAFWVLAASASSPSHSSALSLGLGDISIHLGRCRLEYEGINDMGDYDEYEDEYVMEGEEEDDEVDYEYVDLQKDSDGDGLRDHINDPDDDN